MDHNPAGPKSLYICLTAAFSLMPSLTVTLQTPFNLFLRLLLLFCWCRFVCSWCHFFLKLLQPVLTLCFFVPLLTEYCPNPANTKLSFIYALCFLCSFRVALALLLFWGCEPEAALAKNPDKLPIFRSPISPGEQNNTEERWCTFFCDQSQKVKIRAEEAH